MRSIEIAADDEFLTPCPDWLHKLEKGFVEIHLVFQPALILLSVGKIYIEEKKFRVFSDYNSSFCVECVNAKATPNPDRFFSGEGSHAAITFSFRVVPVGMIALWFQ